MRAYELHGVNDLRREDIEKTGNPIRLGSGAGKGIRNLQLRYSADFHKRNIPFSKRFRVMSFQAWLPHTARVCPEERVGKRVGIFPLIPCRTCPQCRQKKI